MSSNSLRKRTNHTSEGSESPNSSTTDPLMVEHPESIPGPTFSKADGKEHMMNDNQLDTRSKLDRFLQGYTSFMASGLNQDRGIKLLQYTLWMISHWFKNKTLLREACVKLYNELSFARYVLRLLGLPPSLEAARSGSWAAESDKHPVLHKLLGKFMAWSMIGYYPLEHGAYVQWQTPRLFFPKSAAPARLAEKLSAWSCRCWLAYTIAEIVQCWLKLREEQQRSLRLAQLKKKDGGDADEDEDLKIVDPAAQQHLRLQILRDLLFTLPAIHWSLPNWDTSPWLSEPVVNTLMWLESVVCMYQSIKSFQQ